MTGIGPVLDFEGIEPTRDEMIVADGDLERLAGDFQRARARIRIVARALAAELIAMEIDGQREESDEAIGTVVAQIDLDQMHSAFETPPRPFDTPGRARQAGRGPFQVVGCFGKRRANQDHDRARQGSAPIGLGHGEQRADGPALGRGVPDGVDGRAQCLGGFGASHSPSFSFWCEIRGVRYDI